MNFFINKPDIIEKIKPKNKLKINIIVETNPKPEKFLEISAILSNSFWVILGFAKINWSWANDKAFSVVSGSKKLVKI